MSRGVQYPGGPKNLALTTTVVQVSDICIAHHKNTSLSLVVGEIYQLSGVTMYFTVSLHRHNMRLMKVMYQLLGDTGLQLASGLILEWLFGSLLCCHLSW